MTDRLQGVLVHFEHEVREDDAEAITAALRIVKGVAQVTPIVADPASYIAETRAHQQVAQRVVDFARGLAGYP